MALRPEHHSLEIGWTWLGRPWWRTGANVETKLLLLCRAFEQLGCERVELKTDARNTRSRAAMEALSAQFEGIHRRHTKISSGWRDTAWYSVIAPEWPQVGAALQSAWHATASRPARRSQASQSKRDRGLLHSTGRPAGASPKFVASGPLRRRPDAFSPKLPG